MASPFSSEQMLKVPAREILVNHDYIFAAVRGGWVNTLITDLDTARRLLSDH
jgi:hypothetical protein